MNNNLNKTSNSSAENVSFKYFTYDLLYILDDGIMKKNSFLQEVISPIVDLTSDNISQKDLTIPHIVPRAAVTTLNFLLKPFDNDYFKQKTTPSIIETAILYYVLSKSQLASATIDRYITKLLDNTSLNFSNRFVSYISTQYYSIRYKYFNIPVVPDDKVHDAISILQEYNEIYKEIASLDLKKDVVSILMHFFKKNLKHTDIVQLFCTSIIPDLQALDLDDVIPEVKKMLLQEFGDSLTPKERFAIQYPITSISPTNTDPNQNSVPHIYPPTVEHSAEGMSL